MTPRIILGLSAVSSWIHFAPRPWLELGLAAALVTWAVVVVLFERSRSTGWGRW